MVAMADTGEGVLVMTDVFGATPANIALKLLKPGKIEGIAGINLPMLLRALTYRDNDMQTLITKAVSGGRDGVLHM
jgi:PTS system ascorbate-specific IIA component